MTTEAVHLGYVVSHEAWYGPQQYPDHGSISVGRYADAGGCVWEFTIEQGTGHPQLVNSAQIRMWGDSWAAFTEVPDLFRDLAAVVEGREGVSLDAVRKVLDAHGFRDDTPRESPYARTTPAAPDPFAAEYQRRLRAVLAKRTGQRIPEHVTVTVAIEPYQAGEDDVSVAEVEVAGGAHLYLYENYGAYDRFMADLMEASEV